jgi:microcompartment protein CcmL/EutN
VSKHGSEHERCLGVIEVGTVPTGLRAFDALVKETPVRVLAARALTPAKYIAVFEGEVEAVVRGVRCARAIAAQKMLADLVLPQAHPQVREAVTAVRKPRAIDAAGILQTSLVAALVDACDAAAKAAEVEVIEIRLAMGLGGQAYFTMTGEVSSVEAALDAARERATAYGALTDAVLIPRPDPETARRLLKPDAPFSEFGF